MAEPRVNGWRGDPSNRNVWTFEAHREIAKRAQALTEDIAELWLREWRPGGYYPALEAVAARIGRTPRTVMRHLARAREAGLL